MLRIPLKKYPKTEASELAGRVEQARTWHMGVLSINKALESEGVVKLFLVFGP